MKKFFAILLVLALMLSLAACGGAPAAQGDRQPGDGAARAGD
jgi:ABC-type glycerol-3-phosphate transport system substrate-binding protein